MMVSSNYLCRPAAGSGTIDAQIPNTLPERDVFCLSDEKRDE
jgi:hypothetical protein